MSRSSDVPTERDAILLEPSLLCDEHLEVGQRFEIPLMNLMLAVQGRLLESEEFFEIAYRIKNGYGRPDSVPMDDVPESERPGTEHINDTIREIEPLCCWLVEEVENPWPDEEAPPFLAIVAEYAGREMAPDGEEVDTDGR